MPNEEKPEWVDALIAEVHASSQPIALTKATPINISINLLVAIVTSVSVVFAGHQLQGRDVDDLNENQQEIRESLEAIDAKQTALGLTIAVSGIGNGNDWKRSPQMQVWCRFAERENEGWVCPDFEKIPKMAQ